jgi:hypothetical protein
MDGLNRAETVAVKNVVQYQFPSDDFLNFRDMDNAGTGAVNSPLLDFNVKAS